ncbi:response regulator transcription factor [Hufsiella ginkgonis]|uniref:HTH luxR-type domain-containing protein n=1 Tax=Hufsiella ginkgonis TaxID=2695274 RepID=A0A7K1Y0W8_9SPHI|nr:LuxR C-terminal-related transcriptional regulator [Hufsiella ginkgonis]MXV16871.1 hypothetical protein [Hufsiella ginkgonis]
MTLPNLIPGLVDKSVEFFGHNMEVYCIHDGRTIEYAAFPMWMREIIMQHMETNPHLVAAVRREKVDFSDFVKKYIYLVFGRIDGIPDIALDGSTNHEFFAFSKREIDILRLVHLTDKEIAERLFISRETVLSHWQNMRRSTGLNNKIQLAISASKRGII